MSMAAGYSRKVAAFTRSSPLLRVELTTENLNFKPASDRRDTPHPIDRDPFRDRVGGLEYR